MAAMEIFIPLCLMGSLAPCRAGGFTGNHLIHSSFMPAKSASSARMNVALTTFAIELHEASRIAATLLRHCAVCCWMVAPTTSPELGSKGP